MKNRIISLVDSLLSVSFLIATVVIILSPAVWRCAAAQTTYRNDAEGARGAIPVDKFSGDISMRFKGRHKEGGDGSDVDIYESLRLNYGSSRSDKMSGFLFGSLREDIDDPGSVFRSIDDTYDKTIHGRLYELYGHVRDVGVVEDVRVGRQYLNDVEDLHFDGVHVGFRPFKGVRMASYGGIPVHLFESSSDGDWIAGASAEYKPVDGSAIRLDYISSNDDGKGSADSHDNLVVLSAWHRVRPWWNMYARYSRLDSLSRDVRIRSSWNFTDINLDVQLSYYKQAQLLDEFTIEFDEFVPLLNGYEPYDQYTVDVYKGMGANMGISLGVSLRELKDESGEGAFNHDYERYYVTYSVYDYPVKGVTVSVTGEDYETAGDDVQSLSLDISKDIDGGMKVSLGTYYSLYKFDTSIASELIRRDDLTNNRFFSDAALKEGERDNVRSYYIKVKREIYNRWEITGKYEIERFDSDTYHTVTTGLRLRF